MVYPTPNTGKLRVRGDTGHFVEEDQSFVGKTPMKRRGWSELKKSKMSRLLKKPSSDAKESGVAPSKVIPKKEAGSV